MSDVHATGEDEPTVEQLVCRCLAAWDHQTALAAVRDQYPTKAEQVAKLLRRLDQRSLRPTGDVAAPPPPTSPPSLPPPEALELPRPLGPSAVEQPVVAAEPPAPRPSRHARSTWIMAILAAAAALAAGVSFSDS